jgi:hypothetical protein
VESGRVNAVLGSLLSVIEILARFVLFLLDSFRFAIRSLERSVDRLHGRGQT